jgi:LPS-assembly lipoprotein
MIYASKYLALLLLILVFNLGGCGFKLRDAPPLPETVESVWLHGSQSNSPFMRILEQRFSDYDINLVSSLEPESDNTLEILIQSDSLERKLLSLFPTGQVAEYELIYQVQYQVNFRHQQQEQFNLYVTREYQDDPDALLAKSRELTLVMTEMREEAAEKLIRILASQIRTE